MNTIKFYIFKLLCLLILIPVMPIAIILMVTSVMLVILLTCLALVDTSIKALVEVLSVKHKELHKKQEKQ